MLDGVGEDAAKQSHNPRCGATAAANTRNSTWLCLSAGGRLAGGYIMHEPLDVALDDADHSARAEKRLDMSFNCATIKGNSAGLFRLASSAQHAARFRISDVEIT
jgi:hypothetical protein